jgi:hypothetical protein
MPEDERLKLILKSSLRGGNSRPMAKLARPKVESINHACRRKAALKSFN